MKKKIFPKFFFPTVLFLCLLLLTGAVPEHLNAASKPLSITSCKLNGSGKKLTVKATVNQKDKNTKKKLYLLALNAYASESGKKSATPIASGKARLGKITLTAKYKSDMLYKKYVIAYKTGKKYQVISNAFYITNPEVLATYTGKGVKTTSKKGLQVENLTDSLELRTQHAVVNWTANSLLTTDTSNAIRYKYRGKNYYFNRSTIENNDALVQAYNKAGTKVTVILLLPNDYADATSSMIYGGINSAQYSSFNTSTQKGCRTFEAMMSFLASRYGVKKNLVSGWILGNEVNQPGEWNYGGGKTLSTYMKEYARSFRICYNAVKSVSKNSKVYISLDYNWNLDADSGGRQHFTTKATLDEFYRQINAKGKIVFQIAYHAYPQGLTDPIFWDDSLATNSTGSTFVNFRNLNVLTNYVKENFGKDYTIMLSEQSFNTAYGEVVQAAAYAYAYYLSEANSMIEAFIYGRHYDHYIETAQGCYWGLYDSAGNKRLIWDVFQYIDSKDSLKFTEPLLSNTDLSKWEDISGFKKSKYSKMPSLRKKASIGNLHIDSTSAVSIFWPLMEYGDGYEVYRNGKKIATVKGTSTAGYTDKKVKAGTTYSYKIRMFKYAPSQKNPDKKVKLYGSFSKTKKVTVSAGTVQWKTDNCSVLGGKISLSWTSQKGVSGYQVVRATSEDGNYKRIADTTKTSFTDSDTASGQAYYYKVRAYVTKKGKNYYGAYSTPLSRQALIQLTGSVSGGQLALSWSKWSGAEKYQIYFAPAGDDNFDKLKTVDAASYSGATYKNESGKTVVFEKGSTWQFEVRAVLDDGTKTPFSNVISVKITEDLTAPEKTDKTKKEPLDTELPEETELPGETEISDETELPGETEIPDGTELPSDSELPGETEISDETELPGDTEIPGETEIPDNTEIPNDTELPEDSQLPEETEVPGETELPGDTELPSDTELPENTEISDDTGLPDDTELTDGTKQPEASDASEKTEIPMETEVLNETVR